MTRVLSPSVYVRYRVKMSEISYAASLVIQVHRPFTTVFLESSLSLKHLYLLSAYSINMLYEISSINTYTATFNVLFYLCLKCRPTLFWGQRRPRSCLFSSSSKAIERNMLENCKNDLAQHPLRRKARTLSRPRVPDQRQCSPNIFVYAMF